MKIFSSILAVILLLPHASAAAPSAQVLTPSIRAGQTIVASFDSLPASVTFDSKPVTPFPFGNSFRALIPVPRTTTVGPHTLTATFPASPTCTPPSSCMTRHTTANVTVTPAYTKTIVLPVPEKLNQTPTQVVQSLSTSNKATAETTKIVSDKTHFTSPFGLPLFDNRKVSSPFGEVRQTGDQKITHYGTDFVMPKGSAVAAINSGVIASAYLDPIYGNTVIVNHGRGIFSVYMHLNSIKAKQGQAVNKGKIIGTLGETGLASGPHLHLSIKVNGISVDPIQFVNSFQ